MKEINAVLKIEAAATILASKIIGRVIDQVARGFGEDESIVHLISVYKTIQAQYPKSTITLPAMFKVMLRRANTVSDEEYGTMLEGLSETAKDLWTASEQSEKQALLDAMPQITELYLQAPAELKAWTELPTIAKWSLLNTMEGDIPNKIRLYKSWADTDRAQNKTNTNAMRLEAAAEAAIEPVFKLVTAFLKTAQSELDMNAASGINVPPRYAQAA